MKSSNQEMHPLYDVSPDDAIGMLVADHKRVANLFADFKRLTESDHDEDKASVVQQICQELTVHTQLEEELFYPAVRKAIQDDDQMDEALVEHAGAKQLIAQLQGVDPEEDLYDAKVTVLGEQIDHHVEEEEGSMFPKARHSGLDMLELGAKMAARKAELQNATGGGVSPPPISSADDLEMAPLPRAPVKKKAAVKGKATKSSAVKSKKKRT